MADNKKKASTRGASSKKPAARAGAAKTSAARTKKATPSKASAKRGAPKRATPKPTRATSTPKPPRADGTARPPRDGFFSFEDEPPRAQTDDAPPSRFQPGFAPECMACPIGLVFFAMKNTKPEVMDHLMKAGLEMFQAIRALMEQYNDRWEQAQTLQRIPIS